MPPLFDIARAANLKTEEECVRYLEKTIWGEFAACPICSGTERNGDVTRLAGRSRKTSRGQLYMCKCRTQFTVTSQTIFSRTHCPLTKWFCAIYAVFKNDSITVREVRKLIQTTYKTAWAVRDKARSIPEFEEDEEGGVYLHKPASPRTQRRWIHTEALKNYRY
jgi:hypothetical protein